MPSLKIILSTRANILLIVSVILLLQLTIASESNEQQFYQQQQQYHLGEGDSTRSRVESLTSEQDDETVEGVNYEWENKNYVVNNKVHKQQQEDMPAIIVNDVQVSSHDDDSSQQQEEERENEVQQQNEFLEAKESRRNVVGISRDNDDEEYGTSYNNIALPPQGILQQFTPYPLMNQQYHQQQQQILFQPNNQPLRVAAIQNGYLDHHQNVQQNDVATQQQQPAVNFIYAPATLKGVHHQQQPQPSVILQELRSLQFHDKSPLMNVLFHPINVPFETNSIAWPSKYQAKTYLPPGEALSRLYIRSSPYVNPFDSFSRRYEISYGNNQHENLRYIVPQQSHILSNFNQFHHQFQPNNQFYPNQHRYVIPQIPFFSSNVPISKNFPPLPYVSPSLRGYKSETPGDIDVRMSNISDDISQKPEKNIQQDNSSGLLNRAGNELDVEITTQQPEIEQRNLEELEVDVTNTNNNQQQGEGERENSENSEEEKLDDEKAPKNVSEAIINEENTTTISTVERTTTEQSDENMIDIITTTTTTEENITNTSQSSDETTTMNTMNSLVDEEMTTTTELPETTTIEIVNDFNN